MTQIVFQPKLNLNQNKKTMGILSHAAAAMGRKGGKVRSPEKMKAIQDNLKKANEALKKAREQRRKAK